MRETCRWRQCFNPAFRILLQIGNRDGKRIGAIGSSAQRHFRLCRHENTSSWNTRARKQFLSQRLRFLSVCVDRELTVEDKEGPSRPYSGLGLPWLAQSVMGPSRPATGFGRLSGLADQSRPTDKRSRRNLPVVQLAVFPRNRLVINRIRLKENMSRPNTS